MHTGVVIPGTAAPSARQRISLPEGVVGDHVGVVGSPGSGKTSRVLVPWMVAALRAGWSVVAIDVKGDPLD